mmetsp:Transcript_7694/g.8704  ORF Transcript_7694/g.8704 Transcript_7694/m.8704 type:complete len:93 (+) Transcript_7694:808-1086(+)
MLGLDVNLLTSMHNEIESNLSKGKKSKRQSVSSRRRRLDGYDEDGITSPNGSCRGRDPNVSDSHIEDLFRYMKKLRYDEKFDEVNEGRHCKI